MAVADPSWKDLGVGRGYIVLEYVKYPGVYPVFSNDRWCSQMVWDRGNVYRRDLI